MKKLLEKKINYAEEAEAPMILGTKILKRLKKDWGEDSDIYYEIEDILINFGSDSPRRLAMALKRVLNNYDMWESPYKGYVNKIEKWTKPTGKVNESRDEEIRKSRFDALVEKIEYYSYIFDKNGTLSKEQISDLLKVRDTIMVFGAYGAKWASFADEILQDCGCDKYSISKLCQDNNGLWESYTPMSDEEYLDKFLSICEENDENKITLFFDDVDGYMIEKRFGDRFKKYLKMHKDDDIRYKAQFVMPNGGYGEEPKCVLTALEYGGYGVSSNYLCDLSFEEFDRLLKNFTHSAGDWHRNDTFMYESYNYNSSEEYDEVYDSFYNAIDDFLKDETLTESDIYLMVKDGVHYDDLKPFITYSLGMMYYYLSEEDEEFYRGVLEDAVNDYYNNDFRIEEALSNPLFRRPVHFIKTYKDEVYEIIDEKINNGLIDYADLYDIYISNDINDELIYEILSETNYDHSINTAKYVLELIGEYYEEAHERHLEDIDENYIYESEDEGGNVSKAKRPSGDVAGEYLSDNKKKEKKEEKGGGKVKAGIAAVAAGAVYAAKKAVDPIIKSFQ